MTADRHRSYRRALDVVAAIDPDWLQEPAREILEELAEHMLLSADTSRVGVPQLALDDVERDALAKLERVGVAQLVRREAAPNTGELVAPWTNRNVRLLDTTSGMTWGVSAA
jgi:hypothetical protein